MSARRILALMVFALLSFSGLGWRLTYLQLVQGEELARKAFLQRAQVLPLEPARGPIFDRDGRVLTQGDTELHVISINALVEDASAVAADLSDLLATPQPELERLLSLNKRHVVLARGVTEEVAARVERERLPGILVLKAEARYGRGQLATHVIGHLDHAGTGTLGIERSFDELLASGPAEAFVAMFDATGQVVRGIGLRRRLESRPPKANSVTLTIDTQVQAVVESAMDASVQRGAVVVADVRTGAILAMASRPNFDPLRLGDYIRDASGPFNNRALLAYPPGSVFKIVVAAAALEERKVEPDERFVCQGAYMVGNKAWPCDAHDPGARVELTFSEAFARSYNPVFVQAAVERLGWEPIMRMALSAGLGGPTGIELGGDTAGNVPLAPTYAGDLANLAIGQGELEATPLQVAGLLAAVANGGKKPNLHVVAEARDSRGLIAYRPERATKRIMSALTAAQLRRMLVDAAREGTGKQAWIPSHGVGGKTGSAQTGRTDGEGNGIAHAWFAGFAPADRPRYVVVVFVEEGQSGAAVAAPVFRLIMERVLDIAP